MTTHHIADTIFAAKRPLKWWKKPVYTNWRVMMHEATELAERVNIRRSTFARKLEISLRWEMYRPHPRIASLLEKNARLQKSCVTPSDRGTLQDSKRFLILLEQARRPQHGPPRSDFDFEKPSKESLAPLPPQDSTTPNLIQLAADALKDPPYPYDQFAYKDAATCAENLFYDAAELLENTEIEADLTVHGNHTKTAGHIKWEEGDSILFRFDSRAFLEFWVELLVTKVDCDPTEGDPTVAATIFGGRWVQTMAITQYGSHRDWTVTATQRNSEIWEFVVEVDETNLMKFKAKIPFV